MDNYKYVTFSANNTRTSNIGIFNSYNDTVEEYSHATVYKTLAENAIREKELMID